MRKRFGAVAVVAAVAAALAIVAGAFARPEAGGVPTASATPVQVQACKTPKIAIEAPLTGPAGFLGTEQREFAQIALAKANAGKKTKIGLILSDTQLDQSLARTVGLRDEGNTNVLAIIGPSTSGAVLTNGKLFSRAKLAAISPSATRVDLTNGQFSSFFRVVPNDAFQASTDANYMLKTLKVKRVYIVDGQEPYSIGLADAVQRLLRAKGVTVTRDSVDPNKETDFSPIVSKVSTSTNIVFLPWQVATAAQTFSQQLLQQGKSAKVFGTDGTYDPSRFKPTNGYVSSFAPDIHGLKSARSLIASYNRQFKKSFGTFGPPSYVATTIAAKAIQKACADGKVTRAEVLKNVRASKTATPWGTTIQFTKRGDIRGAKFFLFKITGGKYKYIG